MIKQLLCILLLSISQIGYAQSNDQFKVRFAKNGEYALIIRDSINWSILEKDSDFLQNKYYKKLSDDLVGVIGYDTTIAKLSYDPEIIDTVSIKGLLKKHKLKLSSKSSLSSTKKIRFEENKDSENEGLVIDIFFNEKKIAQKVFDIDAFDFEKIKNSVDRFFLVHSENQKYYLLYGVIKSSKKTYHSPGTKIEHIQVLFKK